MRLTILRNDIEVPPGHLAKVATSRGLAVDLVALDEGDTLPEPADVDAVAVLGGSMGAYDTQAYPYLADQKAFLKDAVDLGVPVLGLCLGCQLLADALGGKAYLADQPEAEILFLAGIEDDPVAAKLVDVPTWTFHQDTWDLPPGGTLLAMSDSHNQVFRYGSALGVQPHPEVSSDIVQRWMADPRSRAIATRAGADPDVLVEQFSLIDDQVALVAASFFGAWIDEIEVWIARRDAHR